jgi:hypothetical protein
MECKQDDCSQLAVGESKYCYEHRAEARKRFKDMCAAQRAERDEAYRELAELFGRAIEAGKMAGKGCTPEPMHVVDTMTGHRYKPVMDGVCGFAEVVIRPGTSRAAKYAKKYLKASKHYYGGVSIWIHEYNQSYERKLAHARAMAKVLKEAGINAMATGRLD